MNAYTDIKAGIALDHYNYAWAMARNRWAWDFLRRNTEFQDMAAKQTDPPVFRRPVCNGTTVIRAEGNHDVAKQWGLIFVPDLSKNGYEADAFWDTAIFKRTVNVLITPRAEHEADEIVAQSVRYGRVMHLTDTNGNEHLLIRGNGRSVQVKCSGLSMLSLEPVRVRMTIDTISNFDEAIDVIERNKGLFSDDFIADEPQWTRASLLLRNALISFDCHAAGLSYFETARIIYGDAQATRAWESESRAMKDEMRRALKRGTNLVDGGYKDLLVGTKASDPSA